jgi:hypothetical protein
MPGKIRKRPAPAEFIMRRVDGVPLHFLSDPEDPNSALITENFALEFKSYTAYGFAKMIADHIEGRTFIGEEHQTAEIWAQSITRIIDGDGNALTEENGEPAKLTAEFFLSLVEEDREAIKEAINRDANPPNSTQTPPAPGGSGSRPEADQ